MLLLLLLAAAAFIVADPAANTAGSDLGCCLYIHISGYLSTVHAHSLVYLFVYTIFCSGVTRRTVTQTEDDGRGNVRVFQFDPNSSSSSGRRLRY